MRFRDFTAPPATETTAFCSDGWEPESAEGLSGTVTAYLRPVGDDEMELRAVADDFVGPTMTFGFTMPDGTRCERRMTPVGHLPPSFARL